MSAQMIAESSLEQRFVDSHLLALMARATHALSAEFEEQLDRLGVQSQVWRVLAALSGVEDETVTGLAQLCLLQQPTMTKLLDRMARDGLVRRASDPRDRRVVRIRPTERGAELLVQLEALARRHEAEVLARLAPLDGDRLKGLLRAMAALPGRGRRRAA